MLLRCCCRRVSGAVAVLLSTCFGCRRQFADVERGPDALVSPFDDVVCKCLVPWAHGFTDAEGNSIYWLGVNFVTSESIRPPCVVDYTIRLEADNWYYGTGYVIPTCRHCMEAEAAQAAQAAQATAGDNHDEVIPIVELHV